ARTFAAFGFEAVAAITSITFQNSNAVFGAVHQTAETVRSQLMSLIEEGGIACAKTGMLPTSEVVVEVARLFRETELPAPVVDPVMISSSGHRLMEEGVTEFLIRELFPVARLVTPNIPEAETLTGLTITSEASMREAAVRIRASGARAVLIKGGHLGGEDAIDLLDDEGKVTVFRGRRIPNATLHGSGCILSAAIAAGLGGGKSLDAAVAAAKAFVLEEILRQQ
ncbi:MAG: bifunctional hydroxymethylpyrimidine kinase/phosphomethylpyrimidine kinase, partial [Acidobacteriota bacterium]|nr:bifunctional hydroxymethylpyrimidine kinase/phosphomethylpyrimidine kinase [Acidobacteriota bacterium]